MARDFFLLMAGLVFALVSIRVNRFDLLPDIIGFGLIAYSSHGLSQYAQRFGLVRNLAVFAGLFAAVTWVIPAAAAPGLFLFGLILTIVVVWFLLGAVVRYVEERDRPDLAGHAVLYRRIYVGIASAAFLIHWAAVFRPEAAADFVVLMAIATLVILGFILRLFYVVAQDVAVDAGTVL